MWKTYASIIYVLMMGLALISGPNVESLGVSSTQAGLTPFIGTLSRPFQTQGIGIDLPQITYAYGQTKTSFADNAANLTLSVLNIGGLTPTVSTFQNSTTADYRFSAVAGLNLISGDLFFTTQGYNNLVIIKGTITNGGTSTLVLQLSGSALGFSPGATMVSQGHLGFDWSADAGLAAWNNATKQLTFTLSSNFNIDPLALDNTFFKSCAAVTSCTTGSSTVGINDVIIVACTALQTTDTFSVTDNLGSHLSWHLRKSLSQTGLILDEFYAVNTATQSFTITCQTSGAAVTMDVKAMGISGADTTTIFDSNAAVPCTNTGVGTSQTCSVSTTNAYDFIYGLYSDIAISTFSACSGFSIAGNTATPFIDYKIVTVAQTNLSVCATTSIAQTWSEIADAVMGLTLASTTTATTTTTTTTTFSSTTVKTSAPGDLWVVTIPVFFSILLIIGIRRRR